MEGEEIPLDDIPVENAAHKLWREKVNDLKHSFRTWKLPKVKICCAFFKTLKIHMFSFG